MDRFVSKILFVPLVLLAYLRVSLGIDLFFSPDTSSGDVGQMVLLSGRIGPSDLLRGFTVYLAYDTSLIDLSEPPVPGSLIADRQGLQFNYFDHVPIHPDRLEIGGTIFGTDFWAGPGELFQVRFLLRSCADAPITSAGAPFFVDANGNYPSVTFNPAAVLICDRIPAPVSGLTICPLASSGVSLRWPTVSTDYLGRPLFASPEYLVFRQQMQPTELPPEFVAMTSDTFLIDPEDADGEWLYHIVTRTEP